jgi:hypothetical protein
VVDVAVQSPQPRPESVEEGGVGGGERLDCGESLDALDGVVYAYLCEKDIAGDFSYVGIIAGEELLFHSFNLRMEIGLFLAFL